MRGLPTVVTLVTVAASVLGTYQLMEAVGPDVSDAGDDPVGGGTPKPIAGDAPESLIRAARFANALAKLRDEFGAEARVANLRLAPERLDAQVVRGAGRTALIQLDSDARVTFRAELETVSRARVPLSRIPARAPERIVSTAERRYGARLADVDYLVVSTTAATGKPRWLAYMKGGGYFSARLDGDGVRAPGR